MLSGIQWKEFGTHAQDSWSLIGLGSNTDAFDSSRGHQILQDYFTENKERKSFYLPLRVRAKNESS